MKWRRPTDILGYNEYEWGEKTETIHHHAGLLSLLRQLVPDEINKTVIRSPCSTKNSLSFAKSLFLCPHIGRLISCLLKRAKHHYKVIHLD